MASKKVSALTALTTAGSDDLLYIADTSDSGSSYASKRITVGNFLNGYATQSYVTTLDQQRDRWCTERTWIRSTNWLLH